MFVYPQWLSYETITKSVMQCRELGVRKLGVDFGGGKRGEFLDGQIRLKEIQQCTSHCAVEVLAINYWNDLDLVNAGNGEYDTAVRIAKRAIKVCCEYGIPTLHCPLFRTNDLRCLPGDALPPVLEDLLGSTIELCERNELDLCIESSLSGSQTAYLFAPLQADALFFTMDIGNLASAGHSADEFINILGNKVHHLVHLKGSSEHVDILKSSLISLFDSSWFDNKQAKFLLEDHRLIKDWGNLSREFSLSQVMLKLDLH